MKQNFNYDKLNDLEGFEKGKIKPNPDASGNLPPLSSDTIHHDFAQHSDMLKGLAKTQRENDLLYGKKDIKLNYELLTEPIKDSEGKIIEPSRYLDANPYNPNFELQMLFDSLPKNQQEAFLQVMREAVDKLNTNIDIKKGGK